MKILDKVLCILVLVLFLALIPAYHVTNVFPLEAKMVELERQLQHEKQLTENYRQALDRSALRIDALKQELDAVWGHGVLRDFESVNELLGFLATVKVNYNRWQMPDYVCSDFTMDLVREAEERGYRLFPHTIYITSILGSSLHMTAAAFTWAPYRGEMVRVIVIIEPQTLEVVIMGRILAHGLEIWEGTWPIEEE